MSQSLQEDTCVGLKAYNIIKKRLQHRCFLVNFAAFLGTTILKNIFERLLLTRIVLFFNIFFFNLTKAIVMLIDVFSLIQWCRSLPFN